MSTFAPELESPAPTLRQPTRGTLKRLIHNPLAITAALILVSMISISVFAPLIAPQDPNFAVLDLTNAPSGGQYLLGGDGSGRDILSRLIFGGRLTLLGALVTVAVAASIGVPLGLIAGYRGGWIDHIAAWLANFLIVLPGTLVLVSLFSVIGPNILLSMAALGVLISPNFFRVTRNQVIAVRNELYVDAARVSGLSSLRIMAKHIFPVVRGPIIILCASVSGIAIIVQSGLEFIGLGDPSTPTWGGMLQDAFTNLFLTPLAFLPPGLTIGITVASFILLGNAIRDALNDADTVTIRRAKSGRTVAKTDAVDGDVAITKASDAYLAIQDLRVGYPQRNGSSVSVVNGVGFSVREGEVFGLVGESGSGKTQTVLAILGLLPVGGEIRGGTISLDGKSLRSLAPREMRKMLGRHIGYIPQEPMSNLDPALRIGAQLREPMELVGGLSRSQSKEKALHLLGRVGISDPLRVFNSYPHQISGGMAQRVLIAGAISCDPELLIADEPTTALDVTVQSEILDLIRDIQAERHMAVILVTHNLGVVADICDSVAVMKDGLIVEWNSVRELFARPTHPYTVELLGSTLDDAALRLPLGHTVSSSVSNAHVEETVK